MAFTEQIDRLNECFYFDRRDNEFYSVFITDFLLTDKDSKANYSNNPYSEDELALLKERLDRQESNDPSILPLPRLTVDERKKMMQGFLVTRSEFDNNELLQKSVDTENGRTDLDFNSLLDVETKQKWDQFKAAFVREKVDSFCNLNNIDIEAAALWKEDKMIKVELDLTDERKPAITKSSKPWWKFW